MKIFNWIHRHRSPYNVHHSEVSMVEDGASVRRSVSSSIRKDDKEPLLEEEESTKGEWELDRILTIGTLAMDPLKLNAAANLQDEEGDNGGNHINDHHDMNSTMIWVKEDVVDVPNHELEMCKVHVHDDLITNNVVKRSSNEIEEVEDEELMAYEKLSKRVTLLDLFLADASHVSVVAEKEKLQLEHDDHYAYVEEDGTDDKAVTAKEIKTKKKKKEKLLLYKKLASALGGKKGFSSKLIHQGDHAHAPPLKKLQRFMTRMMKKKIHPGDMEEAARLQNKGQVELINEDEDDVVPMGIEDNYPYLLYPTWQRCH